MNKPNNNPRSHIVLALLCLGSIVPAGAEEPAELFLKQLRANRYFDTALLYLDRIEKGEPAPQSIRSAIALERAQTYLEAATASRNAVKRDESFVKAEEQLRAFVNQGGTHERFAEARLQLGKLLLTRAALLMDGKDVDDAKRTTAREALDGAAKVFDDMVEDLRGKLKDMQGNKIKPGDAKAIALREQYRREFLLAILLGGDVRERSADTVTDTAERNKRLDDSLTKYNELAEKYGSFVPGAQAAFYIGRVQEKKGDPDAALAAYQNTLKQPEVDALRINKTESAARAITILLSKDPPQYAAAVSLGADWIAGLRPNERSIPEWQVLRLALAKAYLGKAEKEKPADAKKSTKNARTLLVAASRVSGVHQDETREVLASLGVEDKSQDEPVFETPKSFSEALAASRDLVEAAKTAALPMRVLKDEIAKGGDNVPQLKEQLTNAEAEIQRQHAKASFTIQQGLSLVTDEDTQESVNQGRFFLCWLESQRKRYWDSAVVGEFVARRFPSDPLALQCGVVALTAYQGMLTSADENKQVSIMKQIEPLAVFLLEKWPDDPTSETAAALLVQISMLNQRWDDAEKHLASLRADSPQRARFQSLLGQYLWNEYLALAEAGGAEADTMLQRCTKQLQEGLDAVKREEVNGTTLMSALLLAKSQIRGGVPKQALATLEHDTYGPLKRLRGDDAIAPPATGYKADAYRTALQSLVEQLTDGGNSDALLPKAQQLMNDLRDAMQSEADSEKKLISIYYTLASDIRKKIDSADPSKRQQLIAAFKLFLTNVGKQSTDPTTVHWVAQTFIEMGKAAMGDASPPATGQAEELLDAAITQLTALLEKTADDPDTQRQIRFELATTSRLMGRYKEAIDQLDAILQQKNSMIDAQMEAALCYQQWADVINPKYAKAAYGSAMSGARKKDGKNVIWGWGRLAQLTAGKPAFRATFFDARLQLAECRFMIGQRSPVASDKKKYADQAEKDVLGTMRLYKDLGGPETRQRYDQLMRRIQRAQGNQPTGLPQ